MGEDFLSVFSEPHFGRTQSLNDYGRRTWGSGASDGHGHYIAQHFNVFPDGMITTGRHLNSTPIGIKSKLYIKDRKCEHLNKN